MRGMGTWLVAGLTVTLAACGGAPPAERKDAAPPRAFEVVYGDTLYTRDGGTTKLPGGVAEAPQLLRVPEGLVYTAAVGGLRLLGDDGKSRQLPGSGHVMDVVRVPSGLLYLAGEELRRYAEDGAAPVLGKAEEFAVSAEGDWVAWSHQGRIFAARLTEQGLADQRDVAAGRDVLVHGWLGDRVVLIRQQCCGGDDPEVSWDVWDPARGDFVAEWSTPGKTRLLTPTDDQRRYYGLVPKPGQDSHACLAELDPDQRFRAVRTGCGLTVQRHESEIAYGGDGWLVIRPYETAGPVEFVAVGTAFDSPKRLTGCPGGDGLGDPWLVDSDWDTPTSMLWVGPSGVTRCRIDAAGGKVTVERPRLDVPSGQPGYLVRTAA